MKSLSKIVRRWQTKPRDAVDTQLAALAERLQAVRPQHVHDHLVVLSIEQALVAADGGNPAIGAILVDAQHRVVERAGPCNIKPHFRSDLHAEMQLMNQFETSHRFARQEDVVRFMSGMTLVSSLEPCAMCTPRLIMSGITTVLHAADDTAGGMVNAQHNLPPVWHELIAKGGKHFGRADCAAELREIAFQAFLITIMNSGRTDLWPDAKRG